MTTTSPLLKNGYDGWDSHQQALMRAVTPLTPEQLAWRPAPNQSALPSTIDTLPLETDVDVVVRVSRTRVTLETLVQAFTEGATAEKIAQQYSVVSLADIYSVIGYHLRRHNEVDAYLQERRQQVKEIRAHNGALNSPVGIRERLLSRRSTGTA